RMACVGLIAAARPNGESWPAIAVTTAAVPLAWVAPRVAAVSHADHADTAVDVTGKLSGTPGMPLVGPVGYLAISAALTQAGAAGLPTANRAEVRLSAGCRRPLIFAYTAP